MFGSGNSVMVPVGVILPILLAVPSENQRFPSAPTVMFQGSRRPSESCHWVDDALRRDAADAVARCCTNQRAPSGPAVMPSGRLSEWGRLNSVITPSVVMRPILLRPASVNQMLPSAPTAIPSGWLFAEMVGNGVMTPSGVIRPTWSACHIVNQRLPSGPVTIVSGEASRPGAGTRR